jgi:hypothetical protein
MDSCGQHYSYNYRPESSVYANANGTSADLYCFPRKTGWVLGGSKQLGHLDADGAWCGEETVGPTLRIDGHEVPAPIFDVHRAILALLSDGQLDIKLCDLHAGIGYRYIRDTPPDAVRLSLIPVTLGDVRKAVIHNYGHGGAGFTLSWGCAMEVVQLVAGLASHRSSHDEQKHLSSLAGDGLLVRMREVIHELVREETKAQEGGGSLGGI